ncbi:hypothetical protein J2X20_004358 [Pelomonas saccharophila]|uniref:Uncharacterized protein n=1 Tax=Roseateles saccharophilus TaxID=304 RepID=A0ABU1YS61_ROSSA|nr:hypothetical protein [Roseateles saccharophilus]MDR7271690.1 hypothetical protein [Roseateles saccharophilus]
MNAFTKVLAQVGLPLLGALGNAASGMTLDAEAVERVVAADRQRGKSHSERMAAQADAETGRRVAPPKDASCPRDKLTLFSGVVISYRREVGVTTLRIRTDWATVESVQLRHPGSNDPSPRFLIERAPFTPADWARIESAPGKLRPGMRAAAWVCSDGSQPLIDWQPPQPRQ